MSFSILLSDSPGTRHNGAVFRSKPVVPTTPPEWLVVGLGNPGAEYKNTRHNVGFDVIDRLAERHRIRVEGSKHQGRYGDGLIGETVVRLLRPLTYMNLSGQCVSPHLRDLKILTDHVLVVTDDTDLAPGRIRLRAGGSAGGHNGHKSLIHSLGTPDYQRIKIGIGRVSKDRTVDHVLGKITGEDREPILTSLDEAADAVELILKSGLATAMDRYNPKGG